MCTNTDSVEILTYVTGQYPLTFQLNPLAAGYNYTICDSRTERVAVTFTPQFTTTTSPDSLITQITKADLSASNPDCTPMDGPLRWMCSFGPEASTHFSTFMVTKDGERLLTARQSEGRAHCGARCCRGGPRPLFGRPAALVVQGRKRARGGSSCHRAAGRRQPCSWQAAVRTRAAAHDATHSPPQC